MAEFNPLAARRYLEVARRVLGEDLELGTVTPELGLTKIVDLDPIEDRIHKKVRHWSTGIVPIAANVAGKGRLEVAIPAGLNLLVVVLGGKHVNPVTGSLLR